MAAGGNPTIAGVMAPRRSSNRRPASWLHATTLLGLSACVERQQLYARIQSEIPPAAGRKHDRPESCLQSPARPSQQGLSCADSTAWAIGRRPHGPGRNSRSVMPRGYGRNSAPCLLRCSISSSRACARVIRASTCESSAGVSFLPCADAEATIVDASSSKWAHSCSLAATGDVSNAMVIFVPPTAGPVDRLPILY